MIRLPVTLSILAALLWSASVSARADGTDDATDDARPPAVLVGGESLPASLVSVDADGAFRFTTSAGEQAVDHQRLVRWGNPAEPSGGRVVVLADGSLVTALEWVVGTRRQPLLLENAALTFTASLFEHVTVPRHLVRGIVLQLPADPLQRDRALHEVDSYAENEDAILLIGGDRLTGRIEELNGETVSLETSLGPAEVPLSRVRALLFDPSLSDLAAESSQRILVGLSDGSLLAARELRRESDVLQFKLTGNIVWEGASADDVVSLQPVGGDVTYLSDLEPHRFVHVPYLELTSGLGRDRNVVGSRLRADGKLFSKGLGVHSGARIVYRLDGSQERFAALAAIDDSAGRGGSAVFRVLLAEGGAWREAFTSPVIRGGDEPVPISVPLGEAQGLALVVDYADRGDELDHANWLDARLE